MIHVGKDKTGVELTIIELKGTHDLFSLHL